MDKGLRQSMRLHVHSLLSCAWVVVLLCFFSSMVCAQEDATTQTVEGLRLPLERHPNGRVETMVQVNRARMKGSEIFAEGGIQLLMLSDAGITNTIATAEAGVFDQKNKTATCTGAVSLKSEGFELYGTNLYWVSKMNIVRIETNAVLVIDREGKSAVKALK